MLQFSFILAVITFIGFILIWYKLPRCIKKVFGRFPLFFDFILSACIYLFLGQTLMALLAAGLFGILISGFLLIAKKTYLGDSKAKENT